MKFIKKIISLVFLLVFINSLHAQSNDFELLGRWGEGSCESVEVDEEYIFMGKGTYIDIYANTPSYNFITRIITPGIVEDILKDADHLYIANDQFGLSIFDIADINNPKEIGSLQLPGITHRIKLYDNHLYTANYEEGVRIVSVKDPYNPMEVAFYKTGAMVMNIDLKDNYLYSTQYSKIDICDIINPSDPVFVKRFSTFVWCWDLVIKDDYIFAQCYDRDMGSFLLSCSIKDPRNPMIKSLAPVLGNILGLTDTLAFVLRHNAVRIVNITNPDSIFFLSEFETYGDKENIKTLGNLAYIADANNGLIVVDLEDIDNPVYVKSFPSPGSTDGLIVEDEYVYISNQGLRIIDASNPSKLSVIGTFTTQCGTDIIFKKDNLIFLRDVHIGGMRIINIDSLNAPKEISQIIPYRNLIESIASHKNYLYLAQVDSLGIWNIADPTSPVHIKTLSFQGNCFAMIVEDSLLITSQGIGGIIIYDLSDPSNPNLKSSLETNPHPNKLIMLNKYIIGGTYNGFKIIDASDPYALVEKLNYTLNIYTCDLKTSNNYLYVAHADSGVTIIDLTNILAPVVAGVFDTPGIAWKLDTVDDKIFVADTRYGMSIIRNNLITDISEQIPFPISFKLSQNYPNPFNPSTIIQFSISRKEFVKVKVCDVLGKEIATLVNEEKPAGFYEVEFDGSNLSSGVYLYSLIVNGVIQNKKMILLK